MDNQKDDCHYLQKIIKDIDYVIEHTKDIDIESLENNEVLLDSVLFRFIQISENSQSLSAEYMEKTKHLPWKYLKSMQNRIVHAYDVVRIDIVYDTVKKDFPAFKEELLHTLPHDTEPM